MQSADHALVSGLVGGFMVKLKMEHGIITAVEQEADEHGNYLGSVLLYHSSGKLYRVTTEELPSPLDQLLDLRAEVRGA